jgi:hypothetical protein
MRHFQFLGGIDPLPTLIELQRQPELWDADISRKGYDGSPHKDVSDIWVRYGSLGDLKFLPAWYCLPSLRPIVFTVMIRVQAVELGGVLITRVPAKKSVAPHIDSGWHAERYNTKVYVALQTSDQCVNNIEDESVVMKGGEAWIFRNTVMHDVVNNGDDDRISVIVCTRCES